MEADKNLDSITNPLFGLDPLLELEEILDSVGLGISSILEL